MGNSAKVQIFEHKDPERAKAATDFQNAKISALGACVDTCELTQSSKGISLPKKEVFRVIFLVLLRKADSRQ